MLTNLLKTPLPIMTLGAQDHSTLNAALIDDVNVMMKKHKWTCHVCKVQMPGMMEVDHTKGHNLSSKDGMKPICQCCHDRKHILWAASRGRITVMHAPDISYEEISQLTWSLVVHSGQSNFNIDHRKILRDLESRREDAFGVLGHDNIEAIFEAILTVADTQDEKSMMARLEEIDRHIKIVPSILFEENPDIKVWASGGFQGPAEDWRNDVTANLSVGYDALKKAGDALRSKL